jgi:hypothetical protein
MSLSFQECHSKNDYSSREYKVNLSHKFAVRQAIYPAGYQGITNTCSFISDEPEN